MDPLDTQAFPPQEAMETPAFQTPPVESGIDNNGLNAPLPADPGIVPSTVPQVPQEPQAPEEQKVPYSRMKSVIDARREAERRAEEAEQRLNELLSRSEEPRQQNNNNVGQYNGDLPSYWSKMYGDNENSRLAYSYELERQNALREEFRREALDAVRQERNQETQVIATNERTIDENLEDLSYGIGRELTEQEEAAILDIVDEYTPKDEEGNYSGNLIPFEKAWDIYNMKLAQATGAITRQRRIPTVATNTPTSGESTTKEQDNKDWNPLDWNSFRKRIPN